jgi:hypothetical protein
MRQNLISMFALFFCCTLAVIAATLNKWPVHLVLIPTIFVFLLTKRINSGATRQ